MAQLFANNASTLIASAITNVATSIPLTAGKGALFPSPTGGDYFYATLVGYTGQSETSWEVVKCTARSADTLTVVRGQEGTTAVAWAANTLIELRVTSAAMANLAQLNAASNAFSGSVSASNLSGTNTGDNAANTNYANDYRAANFVAGTNYQAPIGTISGLAKGNGANALTAAVAGTDYQAPIGTITGIVKGNGANALAAATAADIVNAIGSTAVANATTAASTTGNSGGITYKDTRATDYAPFSYPGGSIHLKTNATDGLSDGGTYHAIFDITQWSDSSGGLAHQLGLTDNGNLWHRASSGVGWGAWKKQLDASNYNSYAPTLTGTGASGTWGISITGSAASATNSSYAQYLWSTSHSGTYYVSAAWDGTYWLMTSNHGAPVRVGYADNATAAGVVSSTSASPSSSSPGTGLRPFYQWGGTNNAGNVPNDTTAYLTGFTVGSHPSDPNYGFQIVQNMWDDNVWTRSRNTTWGAWRLLLNDSNYTNYAPTKTGGGASGTWGISITGSAGSAPASDVYAWAKAATKPSYTYSEVGAPSTTGTNASGTWGISITGSAGSAPASDVYAWAKAATKPTYTASEVGAAPATSGSNILSGDGSGGFSNVTIGSGLSLSAGTLSATATTSGLGAGQTWQDVTASRAGSTTYTNSTGKPIMVRVGFNAAGAGVFGVYFTVAGTPIGVQTVTYSATSGYQNNDVIVVPAGATYSLTLASATLIKWFELR